MQAEATYGHISHWRVSAVTNMCRLFFNAISFNQDLSSWDVSAVTNMHMMFMSASSFNQDLSGWDVSGVSDDYVSTMTRMFHDANSLESIPAW